MRVLPLFATLALVTGCPPSASSSGPDASGLSIRSDAAILDAAPDTAAPASAPDAGIIDEPLPPSSSEEMTTRVKHLLEAIAHDNPDLATDMLFPRDAYLAARDSADPGKAWDNKLAASFRKNVQRLHKRTHGIEKAQFVSFEIGHAVQQATPKKRDWKRPLWRVRHSRLTFTVDGKTQRVDIGEMTSWKGAWYVTKLR
jgi:hypothetical protein